MGGSAGIGLNTARLAREEGADVVLVGCDPDRLRKAAAEVGATETTAFDAASPFGTWSPTTTNTTTPTAKTTEIGAY